MRTACTSPGRRWMLIAGATSLVALVGIIPARGATKTTKKATATTAKAKSTTTVPKTSTTQSGATTVVSSGSESTSTVVRSSSTTAGGSTSTTLPKRTIPLFILGQGPLLDLNATQVAQMAAGQAQTIDVRAVSGLGASGAGTVLLDVRVNSPSSAGRVSFTPIAPEYARTLVGVSTAFAAGSTTVTRLAVPVGNEGRIRVETTPGPGGLRIDVGGWIVNGTVGEPSSTPLEICRIVDTRNGVGGYRGQVTQLIDIPGAGTGVGKVPAATAERSPTLVLFQITASGAVAPGEIGVGPTGGGSPSLIMQVTPGTDTKAVYAIPVGADARLSFAPTGSPAFLTVDAVGWFDRTGKAEPAGPC